MVKGKLWFVIGVLVICSMMTRAWSSEEPYYTKPFTIATGSQPDFLDPQLKPLIANNTLATYVFDSLFIMRNGKPETVLVESYEVESPIKWLFKLKQGVYFHDGDELTTKDVVATFERGSKPKHVRTYDFVHDLTVKAMDKYTFTIETESPMPELLTRLMAVDILKHTAKEALPEQFYDGTFMVGTGPYRFIRQKDFGLFEFKAFDRYHRGKAYLQHIKLLVVLDEEERIKGFLSGKFDLIDMVAARDVERIKKAKHVNFTAPPGVLLYLLLPDVYRDESPDIRDHQGNLMKENPLKKLKVRQAISLSIDRAKLVEQFYFGEMGAEEASQLVSQDSLFASKRLLPDKQNIKKARQLLSEAGYPNGFQITLTDQDARRDMLSAIASMISKVGIQAKAQTFPPDVYFKNLLSGYQYSMGGVFWSEVGDLGRMLSSLIKTKGAGNAGRYSNADIDELIDHALKQFNTTVRNRKLRYANEMAMKDLAIIPILYRNDIWSVRGDMVFMPPDRQFTEAYYIRSESQR